MFILFPLSVRLSVYLSPPFYLYFKSLHLLPWPVFCRSYVLNVKFSSDDIKGFVNDTKRIRTNSVLKSTTTAMKVTKYDNKI